MTEKQKRFCDEYLIDCNATRAYMAAYPSVTQEESARRCGSRLLTKVDIKNYIEEQMEKLRSDKVADAREVLEYLTSVMRGESESSVVLALGAGDGVSYAKEIRKPPDEKERLKAAELLGKRHSLFTDKVDLDASVQVIFEGESELAD